MTASRLRLVLFPLALFLAALGLRWPFLHRTIWNIDEGVTFTVGEQLRHGAVLYRDAADHRPPLVPYLKAALFAVFGEWNTYAIHVVVALLLGASALLLWRICRRLGDETTGIAAALVFTALSFVMLDPVDALSAHTGWFLVFFSAAGFAAFARAVSKNSLPFGTLSGVLFGFSFLCKQPGLLDFGVTWILLALLAFETPSARRAHLRLWLALLAGFAAPSLAFIAYFAAHHALHDALYYAFTYNTQVYVPEVPQLERLAMMRRPFELAYASAPAALVLVLGGAVALLVHVSRSFRASPFRAPLLPWLILGWSATGLLSTGLSGRGFSHYSAQAVAGFSLAAGWTLARLWEQRHQSRPLLSRLVVPVVVVAALCLGFDCVRRYRTIGTSEDFGRIAGELIARQSSPTDRLLVWGYSPELYVYAQRLPASRFLYSNFVTGMIPWTNLDPFVDTRYASVPGSHDALARDLLQYPPAVILDTGNNNGYLKYPISGEPTLWSVIPAHYAQVDATTFAPRGMRLFRRLAALTETPPPPDTPENPLVALTGFALLDRHEPATLQVRAPAGATRVELYAGPRCVAALDCPPDRPVDARFFAAPSAPGVLFRALVVTPAGRSLSAPFDFNAFAGRAAHPQLTGPALHLASSSLLPSVTRHDGPPSPSPELPDTWRVDPPAELVYVCPPDVVSVSFVHGQEPAVQGKSDGYDLLVTFRADDGKTYELHRQRLHPRTVAPDQKPQPARLVLPPHLGGELTFRFLAGEKNNADYDWIFFGQLTGEIRGPTLVLGDRVILPSRGEGPDHVALRQTGAHRWATHAPTVLEWPRPDALASLDLTFGLEDGSYTAPTGHTDGIDVSLDLVGDDGQTRRLFSKTLWPFNHPEHRGPQHAHVDLPPHTPGRLVYRVEPGPNRDVSWDWAWLEDPLGDGYGPAIVLDATHRIVADSSRILDGSPSHRDGPDRWGAHADSELVFTRPANLAAVTFTYGLADGAARDETGKRRSDGVVVTVEFTPSGSDTPVEIFRRALDPFANASDFGPQTTTLELRPWQDGRLAFRIDRGPNHDASFDWAFWGPFTGRNETE